MYIYPLIVLIYLTFLVFNSSNYCQSNCRCIFGPYIYICFSFMFIMQQNWRTGSLVYAGILLESRLAWHCITIMMTMTACDMTGIIIIIIIMTGVWVLSHLGRRPRQKWTQSQCGAQVLSESVDDWKVSYFAFCEPSQLHALVSKKISIWN